MVEAMKNELAALATALRAGSEELAVLVSAFLSGMAPWVWVAACLFCGFWMIELLAGLTRVRSGRRRRR